MNKAPCKDCPNREVGCHSTCDKYIVFRKERDELNKIINKKKEEEYAIDRTRYDRAFKVKQKQKTKYWY